MRDRLCTLIETIDERRALLDDFFESIQTLIGNEYPDSEVKELSPDDRDKILWLATLTYSRLIKITEGVDKLCDQLMRIGDQSSDIEDYICGVSDYI